MKKMHQLALALPAIFLSPAAMASEWGCQVLLCLANPAGPTAVATCVPPITRLWAALNKPRPDPFPTCEEANSRNGDSFARPSYGYFDRCPSGTTALSVGASAIQLTRATYNSMAASNAVATRIGAVGIGEGDGLQPADDQSLPNKVCVAGELGAVWLPSTDPENSLPVQGRAFQQVVTLPPNPTGRYIDVFVNGNLFNRVKY